MRRTVLLLVLLGLLVPVADGLTSVADKDLMDFGRVVNSPQSASHNRGGGAGGGGGGSTSGGGSSKASKASKHNSFWDDHHDKNHQQPYFDNSTVTNVTSQLGTTTYLNCRVKQLGDRTVSWIRRHDFHILTSGLYTYTNDQRFHAIHLDRSDDWTLQIKYVQKRDEGMYECQVTWDHGILSLFVTLNVVVPKASIIGAPDYYIKSGSTINLTCTITQSPEPPVYVFWYHNERMINYDTMRGGITVKTEKGEVTSSTLLIANAQHSDSGNYTCSPSSTEPTSITVHVLNGDKPAPIKDPQTSTGSCSLTLTLRLLFVTSSLVVFIMR